MRMICLWTGHLARESMVYHFFFCTYEAQIMPNRRNQAFANMISRATSVQEERAPNIAHLGNFEASSKVTSIPSLARAAAA